MTDLEIIAQVVGVAGMALNIVSFVQKKQRTIILFQLFSSVFWIAHYGLLGIAQGTVLVGFILNIVAVFRAYVYANKEKFHAESNWWIVGFTVAYIASYVCAFTMFGKDPTLRNFLLELLPVIAMTSLTIGFRMKKASNVRAMGYINSPAWLIYNIAHFSISGILCEAFTLISMTIGVLKHDIKKKEK